MNMICLVITCYIILYSKEKKMYKIINKQQEVTNRHCIYIVILQMKYYKIADVKEIIEGIDQSDSKRT